MILASQSHQTGLQKPLFALLVTAFAALSFSATAHASSIVVDGGFESAGGGNVYYAGQSIDGGSWNVTVGNVYIDSGDPYVYDGNNSLNLTYTNPYTDNAVSQVISTVVGQAYNLTFFANADTPNTFAVTENGSSAAGSPGSIVDNGFPDPTNNSSLFEEYLIKFVATSTTTNLTLSSTGNPPIGSSVGSVMIDDVNVTPTPEPGSIVTLLTGLIAVGFVVGKKRLGFSV